MWQPFCSSSNIWYWFRKPELPNGWTAAIVDNSQFFEPPLRTHYRIFAAAEGMQEIAGTASYLDFEVAKAEALNLAMAQPDVTKVRSIRRRPGLSRQQQIQSSAGIEPALPQIEPIGDDDFDPGDRSDEFDPTG